MLRGAECQSGPYQEQSKECKFDDSEEALVEDSSKNQSETRARHTVSKIFIHYCINELVKISALK